MSAYKIITQQKQWNGITVTVTCIHGYVQCLGGSMHRKRVAISHTEGDVLPLKPDEDYILRKWNNGVYYLVYRHFIVQRLTGQI